MMKSRKLLALSALALLLSLPTLAMASDLQQDLKTPFEPLSNPFENVKEQKLGLREAKVLKNLLARCAYVPVRERQSGAPSVAEARLMSECRAFITPVYMPGWTPGSKQLAQARIRAGLLRLTVVAWDGSDSDGGDQAALGVYDAEGRRIAVYPSLYTYGNVLDTLAYAIDMDLPRVVISDTF